MVRQAEACAEDERKDEHFGRVYPGLPDDLVNFQHDPLAVAVALGWDGATVEAHPLAVTIEAGWLRMRVTDGGRPVRVVTRVDREAFAALWLDAITAGAG